MSNAFIRKLEGFVSLSPEDCAALEAICGKSRDFAADTDIAREGEKAEAMHVIVEGFAVRYKITSDGDRQIFAYLIPGDTCDLHAPLLDRSDHSIGTVTSARIVSIPHSQILKLMDERPTIARALWISTLVDAATLREWIVNLGQREAPQRIAHLFCELHVRLMAVGLATHTSFELPITQLELGDTLGISAIHVNRSLKDLRDAGLVTLKHARIHIPDMERLKEFSGFDPSYLHLQRTSPKMPEVV